MFKGRNRRWAVLVGAAALMVGAFASSPALGTEQVVRLHLGTDSQRFSYGNTNQNLTTAKNGCQITSAEPLIDLASTATGGSSQPGLSSLSIGVKSSGSNSNGTPCSQIDNLEKLEIRPGADLAGRTFSKVRLDLEMTGNAVVVITLKRGTESRVYQLQTGTSIQTAQTQEPGYDTTAPYEVSSSPGDEVDACAAPNSSGPNNFGNDNCLWTIDPNFEFDLIEITTTIGTASLEGSSDFGNDPMYDSLFYLSNRAPVAAADTFSTVEDAVNAAVGNVLSNDSDPDGDPLTVTAITNGATTQGGTVSVATSGEVTYSPAANFNGADTFQYTISDGKGGTASATVTINVTAVNDPPVAVDDSAQTSAGTAVTIDVLANDTDIDGDSLSVQSVTQPGKGTATIVAGGIRYDPGPTFSGSDTFDYVVSDGNGGTDTGTVTISEVICPGTTITVGPEVPGGEVLGRFTFLTTGADCKPFDAEAVELDGTVLFQPRGGQTVDYRAVLRLSPKEAPTGPGFGVFGLLLSYDPLGGTDFRPVPWCIDPVFTDGLVTSATIPNYPTETWCIASAHTVPVTGSSPQTLITEWQAFGKDDPKFQ